MRGRKQAEQRKVQAVEAKKARLALLEAKVSCLEQSVRRINL